MPRVTVKDKNSKSALVFCPIFVLAGIALLFFNERNLILQRQALAEGSDVVIGLEEEDLNEVNDDHDGKLIHFSGNAITDYPAYDTDFGVGLGENFLKVHRTVEMYQWTEEEDSDGNKSYKKEWEDRVVRSASFNRGYDNPTRMAYLSKISIADDIKVGAYSLTGRVVGDMNWYQPYTDLQSNVILDVDVALEATLYDNMYYFGDGSPTKPILGDTRVGFEVIPSGEITVVAKQTESGLDAFIGKKGGSVLLVRPGIHDEDKMFKMADQDLTILSWCLRFMGWIFVFFGFRGMMEPLINCFPFVKRFIETGINIVSVLLATGIAAITVAVAWFMYRPLVSGIAMAVFGLVGIGSWFAVKQVSNKKKHEEAQTAEAQIISEVPEGAPDADVKEIPDALESDTYGTPDDTEVKEEP